MRTVTHILSRELDYIELHTFADWHIGDKHCDLNDIKKQIEYVKTHENAYAICNGDLMNNATRTSVSDSYAEQLTPFEQVNLLCELLEPIKDKILIMTQGNHEARTYRTDGIDLTALVSKQLGIFDRYVREGGVLFIRFGAESRNRKAKDGKVRRISYSVYCTHGSGGGKREGGKANSLADMANIVDCDIYIHAHTHLPMIIKNDYYRTDKRNCSAAQVERLFVNTSAKLNYGGYGQTFGFKPSNKTSPIIYLCGNKNEFSARL